MSSDLRLDAWRDLESAGSESRGLDRVLKDEAMPSRTEVLDDRTCNFTFRSS